MTWIIIAGGFLSLAFLSAVFFWIFGLGRRIQEGEEIARLLDIERGHGESVRRWAKDVDRLVEKNEHLEKELREEFVNGPSVNNVVRILEKAHGVRKDSAPDGSDAT